MISKTKRFDGSSGSVDNPMDGVDKLTGEAELADGHVDGDVRLGLAVSRRDQAACSGCGARENAPSDRVYQVGILGDLDELGWWKQPASGVSPADQALEAYGAHGGPARGSVGIPGRASRLSMAWRERGRVARSGTRPPRSWGRLVAAASRRAPVTFAASSAMSALSQAAHVVVPGGAGRCSPSTTGRGWVPEPARQRFVEGTR